MVIRFLMLTLLSAGIALMGAEGESSDTEMLAYPLDTCIVKGTPVGDKAKTYQHGNQEIKFCCNGCMGKFKKDPAKFLPKIGVTPYPKNVCIVSDEALGEDTAVHVYKGQEVKFCCPPCKAEFDKDPAAHLKKIEGDAEADNGESHNHNHKH